MRPEADLPAIIDTLPLQNYGAPCYRIVVFATFDRVYDSFVYPWPGQERAKI